MNLPPSLAPWAGYLNIFPEEVSLSLGPIIQRVSMLIGSPQPRLNEKTGEPDGFDGLNRRGTYERLLLSEWMLADELEDEFMRRAVMGEHLFLNRAHSSPVGTRASLALFDAGPSQLGSPRIAHIAALIVLANRADSAGSSFSWGVLQQPETPVYREVNASNIMALLAARSHCEVSDNHITAWEKQLATWDGLDDVWLIGGQRLSRVQTEKRSSRLFVEDVLEPDSHELRLSCNSASGVLAAVTLELPANNISTRLLRDPFEGAVPDVQKTTASSYTGSELLFDMTGTKLFTRTAKWGVSAFNVPNSPRAGAGQPRRYHTRKWLPVCAAGRVGRAIALISPEDRFVHLEYCRQAPIKLPPGAYTGYNGNVFFTPAADDGPLMPCFSLPWDGEMAAMDGAGSLFRFSRLQGEAKSLGSRPLSGTVHLVATDVLAVNIWDSRLVYVGREWPDNEFRIVSIGGGHIDRATTLEGKALRAFFGPPSGLAHPQYGLLALEQTDSQWLVITGSERKELVKPYGVKVFGVFTDYHSGPEPGLLAVEDDLQTVSLNGHDWRKEILRAHSTIEHISLSQREPYIAYSTVDGEIVIYSIRHHTDLCRYLPEGER
ncbi:MAG TPA: hypothetical protein VE980_15505 [Pyrinomonadaceae bacterium]|nr:hypothetical protein [Pyrinomonadaceae bacterium]